MPVNDQARSVRGDVLRTALLSGLWYYLCMSRRNNIGFRRQRDEPIEFQVLCRPSPF